MALFEVIWFSFMEDSFRGYRFFFRVITVRLEIGVWEGICWGIVGVGSEI